MRPGLTSFSRLFAVPLVLFALVTVTGCETNFVPLEPSTSQQKDAETAPPAAPLPENRPAPQAQTLPDAEAPPPQAMPQPYGYPQPQYQTPDPGGLVRVGLLLPLSGPSAKAGQALLNAALLAQFETADGRYLLQPYDTQGTVEGATQAVNLAISQGVQVILGPLFSHSVKAITPYVQQAGISAIAFSTDPSAAQPGVYIIGFLLEQQVERVVRKTMEQGLTKFAALAPDTPYGRAVVATLERVLDNYGNAPVKVAFYDPNASDYSSVVRHLANYDFRKSELAKQKAELEGLEDEISQQTLKRLEQLDTYGPVDFEAILVPESGGRLRQVAALLPYYDVDPKQVKLLGMTPWHDPTLGKEPALVGGWYAAPSLGLYESFQDRYITWFGEKPPRIVSLAYDAVALTAILARSPGGSFSQESLTNPSGFAGVDGLFRLLPNGLNERGLAVIEVGRNGLREADPARASFQNY